MQTPSIPDNESPRLALLKALNILDTPRHESFDNLTELVARIFGAPMVAISLVDINRQWFKSSVGMPVCETSRDVSLCGHVIALKQPLVVEDTHLDERFADNPLVREPPFIRSYCGMPLAPFGEEIVGTLCLIDSAPRVYSDNDLALMGRLAKQAEYLLLMHHQGQQLQSHFRQPMSVANSL
ncbi:MAG TPA: GAF domain-containing protein [Pseudomonadales bacterium]|nr:GAF domain-containing protein [Pseudomonadales bacterium]